MSQLVLPMIPTAPESDLRAARTEKRLRILLGHAEAHEREVGAWWTGGTLAVACGWRTSEAGPALRCLACRGALTREVLGRDPRGQEIYVYALARRTRPDELELEDYLERLTQVVRP